MDNALIDTDVILDFFLEGFPVPRGRGLRPKEITAHVVVNPDHLKPFAGKIPRRLGTDQAG